MKNDDGRATSERCFCNQTGLTTWVPISMIRRIAFSTLAASVFLTACVAAQPPAKPQNARTSETTETVVLNGAQTELVKAEISKGLKDPYSAQFPAITARKGSSGLTYVCGLVNAKNSFGAYVGATPFFAIYTQKNGVSLPSTGDIAIQMCRQNGF